MGRAQASGGALIVIRTVRTISRPRPALCTEPLSHLVASAVAYGDQLPVGNGEAPTPHRHVIAATALLVGKAAGARGELPGAAR